MLEGANGTPPEFVKRSNLQPKFADKTGVRTSGSATHEGDPDPHLFGSLLLEENPPRGFLLLLCFFLARGKRKETPLMFLAPPHPAKTWLRHPYSKPDPCGQSAQCAEKSKPAGSKRPALPAIFDARIGNLILGRWSWLTCKGTRQNIPK